MRERPKPQELYRHFKGNLYQIITVAKHEYTGEEMVVYQALYGDFRVWCRELSEFLAEVDRERYPAAEAKYRFTRVEAVEKKEREEDSSSAYIPKRPSQAVTGVMAKTIEEEAEELHMDPLVVAFLDADGASGRIQVLEELRGKATDEMIDIMAMAAGLEIEPGETWERYNNLLGSLRTIERFETNRLRG